MGNFSSLSDKELERQYKAAFRSYLERMEYFALLPNGVSVANLVAIKEKPEEYGITRGEYEQFVLDVAEHICEGVKLGQLRHEHLRRIKAQEEIKALAKKWTKKQLHKAAAVSFKYEPYNGGDITEYLKKVEHAKIKRAQQQGKYWGMFKSIYSPTS